MCQAIAKLELLVGIMGSTFFKNCRLIDGFAERPRDNVDVLIRNGRIDRIGSKIRAPSDAQVIYAAYKTLLPGLIDTHVHLVLDGSLDPVGHLSQESSYVTLLKAVRNASVSLHRGVTTVRDLGGPAGITLALRDAVQQGIVPGPRILTSGQVITTTAGHGHYMGREADDQVGVQHAARLEIKQGVDVIKVMATGGALTPGSSVHLTQFSVEEMLPMVEEAHAHGLKVAAHANGLAGLRNAVEAGVDSIEHGSYADRHVLELMLEKGTYWVPTMTPARIILEGPRSKLISPERFAASSMNWQARRSAVIEGIRIGVRMASGTDAGVTLTDHGLVGMEVETFRMLGMPAMHAIWTATRWAAELLGIQNQVGTVEEGKLADLILVDGDPLVNLSLLRSAVLVVKEGTTVEGNVPPWPEV